MQRWLIHVVLNIMIRYMAVIVTGTALVIVGFENLYLPVSTELYICHPFVFSCDYNVRHQWWLGVVTYMQCNELQKY